MRRSGTRTERAQWACRLALLLPLLGLLPPPARALTVTTHHPRLFFYADSLSVIRNRFLGGPGSGLFNQYKAYVDGYFNADNRALNYADDYA
jgi:hypothetical protein